MLHLISYQNSTARATRRCHSSPTRPEVGSQVQALGPTHGRPHTAATPRSHACPSTWGTWVARTAGSPPDAHPAHSEQSVTCPHVDHHLAVRLSEFIAKFNNMDGTQGQKGWADWIKQVLSPWCDPEHTKFGHLKPAACSGVCREGRPSLGVTPWWPHPGHGPTAVECTVGPRPGSVC